MRNKLNIRSLFNNNNKVIKLFLEWCKNSEELCDYDYEHLCIALELGATNKTTELFHFHTGNVLDWLEEQGYYIELKLNSSLDGSFCDPRVWKIGVPNYSLSYCLNGSNTRNEAVFKGVQRAIEHLESTL